MARRRAENKSLASRSSVATIVGTPFGRIPPWPRFFNTRSLPASDRQCSIRVLLNCTASQREKQICCVSDCAAPAQSGRAFTA